MTPSRDETVAEAKEAIKRQGLAALSIDDLTFDDLDRIAWSGEPRHRVAVSEALSRVATGEVEYLAIRVPSGEPVGKVGIDFARYPEAGYLWQFATHPDLQGLGIGSLLMTGAEARIIRHGVRVARINVDLDNPRARILYERLGFENMGHDTETWERAVTLMQKTLR